MKITHTPLSVSAFLPSSTDAVRDQDQRERECKIMANNHAKRIQTKFQLAQVRNVLFSRVLQKSHNFKKKTDAKFAADVYQVFSRK